MSNESVNPESAPRQGAWVGLFAAGMLAVWLSTYAVALAVISLPVVGVGIALAFRKRTSGIPLIVLLAASSIAVWTSLRDLRIQSDWPTVKDELVVQLSNRLGDRMAHVDGVLQELLDAGQESLGLDRPDAFARLAQSVPVNGHSTSVIAYDAGGTAYAWAGEFQVSPEPIGTTVGVRRSAFHDVMEYRRFLDGGGVVVAQALLNRSGPAARPGSAVLDFNGQARMMMTPSAELDSSDVFDYCIPDCGSASADTVFSVAVEVPLQSEVKRYSLERGGAVVAGLLLLALLLTALLTDGPVRSISIVGIPAVLVATEAGPLLGGQRLFSPATYFAPHLGMFSSSAGSLAASAALVLLCGAFLWRFTIRRSPISFAVSMVVLAGAPYSLRVLARGITPPATGSSPGLWLGWEMAVFLASVIFVLFSAALIRDRDAVPNWVSFVACDWALAAAVLGLLLWKPGPGTAWPDWYTFLWFPALILAVQPAPKLRLLVTAAIVAGSAAALLTWGASIEGRIVLARQDAEHLKEGTDLLVLSLLEGFGADLTLSPAPSTPADLFQTWRGSTLYGEGYPVRLTTLEESGDTLTQLSLARLPDTGEDARSVVQRAWATGQPVIQDYLSVPGHHVAMAVPFDDGTVVLLEVGPNTRLIQPTVIGGLLNGRRGGSAPYDIALSDAVPAGSEDFLRWRREGSRVRGATTIEVPEGRRHLHLDIAMRPVITDVVRGGLVVLLNVTVLSVLWLVGEFAFGKLTFPDRARRWVRLRGYTVKLVTALSLFFVVPTIGFAGWILSRIATEDQRATDILLRRSLADLAESIDLNAPPREQIQSFGTAAPIVRGEAALYDGAMLATVSNSVLVEAGIVSSIVDPAVFRSLVLQDEIEVLKTVNRVREGFRLIGSLDGDERILATIGVDTDGVLSSDASDLLYSVLLATLLGLLAAVLLATRAARSFGSPIQALSRAAGAVGRGETPRLGPGFPPEFVPVVTAFEQMGTDVERHRNALQESVNFTSAVLRNVQTGVVVLDAERSVEAFNPRAEEVLNAELAEGVSIGEATSGEWQEVWDSVESFMRDPTPGYAREFSVGDQRIQVRLASLDREGSAVVVAIDDATELARAERVLAWGEMARQVAHEIKNPLTPIRLGVQHLQRASKGRSDLAGVLDDTAPRILAEIDRLDAIARAFSRFGAPASTDDDLAAVKVASITNEVVGLYGMGHSLSVGMRVDDDFEAIARGDELKEVLINLIDNSRNAGASSVELRLWSEGGVRRLSVSDDGEGMTEDVLPRVFEPHFSTTTSGTGLGLAICKRLVESWGAGIRVESTPGEGTTVHLEWL